MKIPGVSEVMSLMLEEQRKGKRQASADVAAGVQEFTGLVNRAA